MTQVKNAAATDVATFVNQNSLPKTKAVLNQVVADLYTAHIALHQVHWYMRGAGFMVWHPKMDEYMEKGGTLEDIFLKIAEAIGMSNALGKFTPQPNEIKNAEKVQAAETSEKLTASQNG